LPKKLLPVVLALAALLASALAFAGVATARYGPPVAARHKTTVVNVTEKEYKITLSRKTFKPGAYRFMVVNRGKLTHSLAINGPGVPHRRTSRIAPGGSAQLSVTLKKGTYRLTCPIDGHTALGMELSIRVH
jgi:uncharacterized cupredoxin-like copper-binding protein